jgi:hypothetical protein
VCFLALLRERPKPPVQRTPDNVPTGEKRHFACGHSSVSKFGETTGHST